MKKKWQEVRFINPSHNVEELSEVLFNLGAVSITFEDNQDNPIYEPSLNQIELWENTDIIALFEHDVELIEIFEELTEQGYVNYTTQVKCIEEQDWLDNWKKDFVPTQYGNKLWVVPSWIDLSQYAADHNKDISDAVVINLDPGLAFGTGNHPTTKLCLEWLDSLSLKGKRIIDYGCGSGILAIAALKLGAKEVIAVDIDPQAIEATKYNAQNNKVEQGLSTYLVDELPHNLTDLAADVLVANILAGPLVELSSRLTSLILPEGYLGLSGILVEKVSEVIFAYQDRFDLNFVVEEEWVRITGRKICKTDK